MRISSLYIKNFKSIQELKINQIENALILVGKNNTGKTVILDAILALTGDYQIKEKDYNDKNHPIVIGGTLHIDGEDLQILHKEGSVSKYKNYELWEKDFKEKLPSYVEEELHFEYSAKQNGSCYYSDGYKKNNKYIKQLFPTVYFIDHNRDISKLQDDVLDFQGNNEIKDAIKETCMFDEAKKCNHCFECLPVISRKTPGELTTKELVRLLENRISHTDITEFEDALNYNFHKNGGGINRIKFDLSFDVKELMRIKTLLYRSNTSEASNIDDLGAGLKSIYLLSLLESYIDEKNHSITSIIMIEDPEIFLHPQLQKVASEILYRLSKKNQVIFSTHSPNMVFNFSHKQIKQIMLDENYYTVVNEESDIDAILDDLGYTANDLMNVSFVFIVEGKQDSNRLPMLLEKYYSEIYDEDGMLKRISIIPTNSCTNIKTYANLKYINKLYLKDQFLMIRDSDGKNPKYLKKQLCNYYKARQEQDVDNLPRVTEKNVLILKYYSFENYFLDPKVMAKIGVIKNEEEFYTILYAKYRDYLYKLGSTKRMIKATGIRINNKQDLKKNIETIKIYVRGHNLFDIFYNKYKGSRQEEILRQYIEVAPRENFADILDAIDQFVYFENRSKEKKE